MGSSHSLSRDTVPLSKSHIRQFYAVALTRWIPVFGGFVVLAHRVEFQAMFEVASFRESGAQVGLEI
jgi:hypothetical protein